MLEKHSLAFRGWCSLNVEFVPPHTVLGPSAAVRARILIRMPWPPQPTSEAHLPMLNPVAAALPQLDLCTMERTVVIDHQAHPGCFLGRDVRARVDVPLVVRIAAVALPELDLRAIRVRVVVNDDTKGFGVPHRDPSGWIVEVFPVEVEFLPGAAAAVVAFLKLDFHAVPKEVILAGEAVSGISCPNQVEAPALKPALG